MKRLFEIPIAHRGLHTEDMPENSMAAFQNAVNRGYCIETDIHLTKDGALAVFHDDDLSRMTGVSRRVGDCTLAELKEFSLMGTKERIPSLFELLQCVGGKVPLLIEIKDMPKVKGKRIAAVLSQAMEGYGGEYAVQSFNPLYVRAYKKLHPEIACGVLGVDRKNGRTLKDKFINSVVRNLSLNFYVKPDFISYCKEDYFRRRVLKFKGPRFAWVVRSAEEEAAIRPVCDNIIFERYLPEK